MKINYKLDHWIGYPEPLLGVLQPDIRPSGTCEYTLHREFTVVLRRVSDKMLLDLSVEAGFKSDGASAPRIIWPVVRPDGRIRAAALVHDLIYRLKGRVLVIETGVPKFIFLTRAEADHVFLQLMLAAQISEKRAKLTYRMVRLFGPRW